MILVDSAKGSRELLPQLLQYPLNLKAELAQLPFADFCFEGNGRTGTISIGIERKRLHDMLRCIDDNRYTGHQRVGMAQMYQCSFLIIEGEWRVHDQQGYIMTRENGGQWYPLKIPRLVMYNKLRRYLFSVSLSGVHVLYTVGATQTAWDIHEIFHYFQKPFHTHTALLEMQKFNIPTLDRKPKLVRRWANDLEGIGLVHSEDAERIFKTPKRLANSDESEWLKIPGVGVKTAQSVVREIMGLPGKE